MPNGEDDIKRLKREAVMEVREESDMLSPEDQTDNYHKMTTSLTQLVNTKVNEYKGELVLAEKAGLLERLNTNGKLESIVYNMKGIPPKDHIKNK